MANAAIPNLPVAITLDGSEQLEIVQPPGTDGTTKRATTRQIANLASIFDNSLAPESIFGNPTSTTANGTSIVGTAFQVLVYDANGTVGFGQVNLATAAAVTGILPVINGGSGTSFLDANGVILGNGTAALSVVAAATSGYVLTANGTGFPPSYQLGGGLAPQAGLSVLGVTGNATATPAAIVGSTDQVLRVDPTGTGLSFGQVNLSSTSAVTGVLNVSSFVTGIISVPHGGSGTSALTSFGVVFGNGTSPVTISTAFLAGQVLLGQTSTSNPAPTTLVGDIASITAAGTATVNTAAITYAKFQQVTGLSVPGVVGTATAVMAAITGAANQVLRIDPAGNVLGFGQINLSSTAAITGTIASSYFTGVLSVPFGGTGTSALTAFGVVLGNGTAAVTLATAGASGQIFVGQSTISQPQFVTATGDVTISLVGTATIATAAVTFPKFQQMVALSVHANASSATAISTAVAGTANQVLIINNAGTGLAFGQVNLSATAAITGLLTSSYFTGILSVPKGGSGTSSLDANSLLVGNGTSPFSVVANVTAGFVLTSNGTNAVPTFQGAGGLTSQPGLSVLGVAGTATATPTAIIGTADQVLVVNTPGTGLGFGRVNLSTSVAVTGVLPIASGGSNTATAAGAIINFGGLSLTTTGQAFSGGVVLTTLALATAAASTLTFVAGNPPLGTVLINGTAAFVAPSSDCEMDIMVRNAASASTITFSGFNVGSNTGDAYVTTSGNMFIFQLRRINGSSTYAWKALQ